MQMIPTYGTGNFTVHCPKKLLWFLTGMILQVVLLTHLRATDIRYTHIRSLGRSHVPFAIHKTLDSLSRYRLVTS